MSDKKLALLGLSLVLTVAITLLAALVTANGDGTAPNGRDWPDSRDSPSLSSDGLIGRSSESVRDSIPAEPLLDDGEPAVTPQLLVSSLPEAPLIIPQAVRWMKMSEGNAESIRKRVLRRFLVPEDRMLDDVQTAYIAGVEDLYDEQLIPLADEVVEITRERVTQFLSSGHYPCKKVGDGKLEPRSSEGSHWATDAVFEFEGYYCDLGFRSGDYPHLTQLYEDAARLKKERDTVIWNYIGQ
jgi:hypothetical protein